MKPPISVTGILVAALMFAVTVAMHEIARADGGQDAAQSATRLRTNFLSVPGSAKAGGASTDQDKRTNSSDGVRREAPGGG